MGGRHLKKRGPYFKERGVTHMKLQLFHFLIPSSKKITTIITCSLTYSRTTSYFHCLIILGSAPGWRQPARG